MANSSNFLLLYNFGYPVHNVSSIGSPVEAGPDRPRDLSFRMFHLAFGGEIFLRTDVQIRVI